MKALMYIGDNDIRIIEMDKPQPAFGEVCIKVKAVSICGSDLSGYKGKNPMRVAPLVMGHEFAGDIVELGEGVQNLKVGMKVTANPHANCGQCQDCLAGRTHLCNFRRTTGTTMATGSTHGAMAEYVCIAERLVILLPDEVSYDEAALIEPLAVTLRGAKKAGNIKGQCAVVIGAGPIGLLAIQCLKGLGAKAVIATDILDERLEMARKCGADIVVNSKKDDLLKKVKEITAGVGVDAVLDAVGIRESIQQAIEVIRNGGNIVCVGMASPVIEFDLKKLVCHEINLFGSYCYIDEMKQAVDLLKNRQVIMKDLITTIAPLDKGPEVFANLASGNPGDIKVVLRP